MEFQCSAYEFCRAIKIDSIVDEHTCECMGGVVARSIVSPDLTTHLDAVAAMRVRPEVLRCENRPELIRMAMANWG